MIAPFAGGPRTKRMKALCGALLVLLASSVAAQDDVQVESRPTRWRLTWERFDPEDDLDVDLVGVQYDVMTPILRLSSLYASAGVFTAVSGNRGGFYAAGIGGGFAQRLGGGWIVDLGVLAGGGGGGGGERMDGLFVRPSVALEREFRSFGVRVEAAHLDFPDADLRDTHVAAGLTLASELLLGREGDAQAPLPQRALRERPLRVVPTAMRLELEDGTRRKSGRGLGDSIELLGLEADYFLNDWIYVPAAAFGAIDGGVAGFGCALAGLGLSLPLVGDALRVEAQASAGAGGGGDLDTGGGFLWQALGGLHFESPFGIGLSARAGLLSAPDGDLDATAFTAGLSWSSRGIELAYDYPRDGLASEGIDQEFAGIDHPRLVIANKLYSPDADAHREDGEAYERSIELVGVGFDQPLAEWLFLTARAYTAWDGDVGGYAEGLLGLRLETRPFRDERHAFSFGGAAGPAGGGGVDVDSGLLFDWGGGYAFSFTESLALTLRAGRFEAHHGSFEGELYEIGLSWDLRRPFLR